MPAKTSTLTQDDIPRLEKQLERVAAIMSDGQWRTLGQIAAKTGDPEASISARLRNLRQAGNRVERKRINGPTKGLHAYRLAPLGALTSEMVNAMLSQDPEPIWHWDAI